MTEGGDMTKRTPDPRPDAFDFDAHFHPDAVVARHYAAAARARARIGYHEAAHFTAAWFAGFDMADCRVSVQPSLRALGVIEGGGANLTDAELADAQAAALNGVPVALATRITVEAEVFVLFAGQLGAERAERDGLVPPSDPLPEKNSFKDREATLDGFTLEELADKAGEPPVRNDSAQVDDLLLKVSATKSEAEQYSRWLFARALWTVNTEWFWGPCRAVAEALLKADELSGADCVAIAEQAVKPPPLPDCPAYEFDPKTETVRRL
jgi:hypothetical protein